MKLFFFNHYISPQNYKKKKSIFLSMYIKILPKFLYRFLKCPQTVSKFPEVNETTLEMY